VILVFEPAVEAHSAPRRRRLQAQARGLTLPSGGTRATSLRSRPCLLGRSRDHWGVSGHPPRRPGRSGAPCPVFRARRCEDEPLPPASAAVCQPAPTASTFTARASRDPRTTRGSPTFAARWRTPPPSAAPRRAGSRMSPRAELGPAGPTALRLIVWRGADVEHGRRRGALRSGDLVHQPAPT